jgi:hypothetical protein
MSFLVYSGNVALWAAATLEQAITLAAPYVKEEGIVRIEEEPPEGPSRIWAYDYRSAAWIELAGKSVGRPRHSLLVQMVSDAT